MSDVSLGPGWWQGPDGKWYPAELRRPSGPAPSQPDTNPSDPPPTSNGDLTAPPAPSVSPPSAVPAPPAEIPVAAPPPPPPAPPPPSPPSRAAPEPEPVSPVVAVPATPTPAAKPAAPAGMPVTPVPPPFRRGAAPPVPPKEEWNESQGDPEAAAPEVALGAGGIPAVGVALPGIPEVEAPPPEPPAPVGIEPVPEDSFVAPGVQGGPPPRRRGMVVGVVGVVVVLGLAVGGYLVFGSSGPTSSTSATSTTVTTAVPVGATPPSWFCTRSMATVVDRDLGLTSRLVGLQAGSLPGQTVCVYGRGTQYVEMVLTSGATASDVATLQQTDGGLGRKVASVPGLGDTAFVSSGTGSGPTVVVLVGGTLLRIGTANTAVTTAQLEVLARSIVARL